VKRERRRQVIVLSDESGKETVTSGQMRGVPRLEAIPKSARRVEVHDAADHLLATLTVGEFGRTLLYLAGRPAPVYELRGASLAPVIAEAKDRRMLTVRALPETLERVVVVCGSCRASGDLTAEEVHAALPHARNGRASTITVRVSPL
jgi:hypothetical protein